MPLLRTRRAECGSNLPLPLPWGLAPEFSWTQMELSHSPFSLLSSHGQLAHQSKATTLRFHTRSNFSTLTHSDSLSQRTGCLGSESSGSHGWEPTGEPLERWSPSTLWPRHCPLPACPFCLSLFHQAAPLHFSLVPPPFRTLHMAQDDGQLSQARLLSYS